MQIRITSPSNGEVDGVELADFEVGVTYDLDRSLATYLVVMGAAEVVMPASSAVTTADIPWVEERVWMGPKSDLAIAADSGARRRRPMKSDSDP